jgi:spore germination protein GerM
MKKALIIFLAIIVLAVAGLYLLSISGKSSYKNNVVIDKKQDRVVKLFYYSPEKDKDKSGNILCSKQGLVAVERKIPVSKTPIQDTLQLLLKGGLSAKEKTSGITTEFPLPGLELKGASLKNGVLTLEFSDPQNKTSGGSCRVAVLWAQISETARQYDEISDVRFIPEYLFQP